jgi:ParB family chromosome partitioning protein
MTKMDKKELGKGIRALLSESSESEVSSKQLESINQILEIDVKNIIANPYQPRFAFDQENLDELASSIKSLGIIQPLTVRQLSKNQFQLISGERRYRAARIAGLKKVPAFIRKAENTEMLEMALVENIQRSDLNAMEIAISFQRLIEECQISHELLSDRVGKKRSTVTNYIRLLKLPPSIQNALKEDLISMGHARALLGLALIDQQLIVFKAIVSKKLSVRQTEKLVQQIITGKQPRKVIKKEDELKEISDRLSKLLDAQTRVAGSRSGAGKITIKFSSDEELNRIIELLEGN